MKKISQLALLLALTLGFASQSQAALLIEPVLGYSFGTFNTEFSNGDKDDDSIKGPSYGGRLGYQNLGFQLGLDYLASNMDLDGDDFNTTEWAGFVGFEFPILVRVYAAYVFSGTAKGDGDSDVELSGGTGPKVGVGFTMLPFLDLNIEYRSITYDTEEFGPFTLDADYQAVMVGISLPFTL